MLDMTTADKVGLFIGVWGMANAFSRLVGTILGGVVRDLATQIAQRPLAGYILVFGIEAGLLLLSLLLLLRIDVAAFRQQMGQPSGGANYMASECEKRPEKRYACGLVKRAVARSWRPSWYCPNWSDQGSCPCTAPRRAPAISQQVELWM
jgi:hypothetical protein